MKKVLIHVDVNIFNVSEIILTTGSEKEFSLEDYNNGDLVARYKNNTEVFKIKAGYWFGYVELTEKSKLNTEKATVVYI